MEISTVMPTWAQAAWNARARRSRAGFSVIREKDSRVLIQIIGVFGGCQIFFSLVRHHILAAKYLHGRPFGRDRACRLRGAGKQASMRVS